jgi:hypothetical protein
MPANPRVRLSTGRFMVFANVHGSLERRVIARRAGVPIKALSQHRDSSNRLTFSAAPCRLARRQRAMRALER